MGEMIDIRKLDREVQDMMDPMASGSLFRRVQQRNDNNRYYNGLVADQENSTLMDLQREAALRANAGYRPNEAAPNRSFTAADLSTANPDFKAYSHVPFDDGSNTPSAEDFLNGIVRDADVYANMSEDGVNPDSGYVNPAGINPSTGEFVSNPNYVNGIVRDADVYANMSEDGVNPDSGYVNPAGINPSTGEFVSNPNYVPEPKTDLYRVIQSELQSLDDGMSLTGAERMVQAFDQIFAKYENADAEIANMFLGKNNVRKETAYSPFLGR